MAEDSMLWNTTGTGDGPSGGYTQANWVDYHRYFYLPDNETTAGVIPRKGNKLVVTGTASPIAVDTGAAFVYGFFYKNTASLPLTITTPTLGTTGFRVVLRASWAAQTVRAVVVKNSDGVAAIPAATQTAGTTWEITLATGTITIGGVIALTDARVYLSIGTIVTGSMLDTTAADASTLEVASGSMRIKDAGVTAAKLAAAVAGNGLAGGAGTALSVNVDNSSIEINSDTLRVKALGITLAMLAADSVDDTKVGNRVPALIRRIGGDATDWSQYGTTIYTPTNVRFQTGVTRVVLSGGSGSTTVNLPVVFGGEPLVVWGLSYCTVDQPMNYIVNVNTANQFFCQVNPIGGFPTATGEAIFDWLAIGPE